MTAIPTIGLEDLRARIEGDEPLALVDALSPTSFAHSRLPGAVNIPPERVDELAERRIPDRSSPVVVYCASADCDASVDAASRLLALGYEDVRHFADGKKAWIDAGLPVEGKAQARLRRSRP